MEVNRVTPLIMNNIKPFWAEHSAAAYDVATWATGYAFWYERRLYSGAIQAEKNMSTYERIAFMATEVRKLMKEIFPTGNAHIFLESGIARSITNAMLLGEARGAVIAACSNCLSFAEISNSTWKCTLGIRARDSETQKAEAHTTLSAWWGFDIDRTYSEHYKCFSYDESDAIAVLTHAITKLNYEESEE